MARSFDIEEIELSRVRERDEGEQNHFSTSPPGGSATGGSEGDKQKGAEPQWSQFGK